MEALAPPVVAVVVTCDAGPFLEETLASLRDQDYPSLSVLVIDAASEEDPTSRVAAVFPTAYVRRLAANRGFAASANQALELVEGASHLLVCHDDVAPDPDAVRQLVEEAFRSNAGVVAPKLVSWDDPERLLQVGMSADRTGAPATRVEPGELDQAQHDAVRDVFFAPGGCVLVRADLFSALSGFDEAMTLCGEDLDLSWRAHLLGARVVVAPAARVRHKEALSRGLRPLPELAGAGVDEALFGLARRHELRAVLKNYGAFRLLVVLPWLGVLWGVELLWHAAHSRTARVRALAGAVLWNLLRLGQLRSARRAVRAARVASDRQIRELQVGGSARLRDVVRTVVSRLDERSVRRQAQQPGQGEAGADGSDLLPLATWEPGLAASANGGGDGDGAELARRPRRRGAAHRAGEGAAHRIEASAAAGVPSVLPADEPIGVPAGVPAGVPSGQELAGRIEEKPARAPRWRAPLVFWVLVVGLVLFGSRALLGQPFPQIGQLVSLPSWSGLLHTYVDGYRPIGLGSAGASPVVFALLGLGSLLLAGASGLLQHLAVLCALPLAGLGAWRFFRAVPSRWSRMAAAAAYLALPLAYDSLARGDWSALVAYAGAPWVLSRLSEATGLAPFSRGQDPPAGLRAKVRWWGRKAAALGLLVAVLGAFAPTVAVVVLVSGLGLVLAGGLAGDGRRGARALGLAIGGVGVAMVLALPWSFDVAAGAGHLGAFGPALTGHLSLGDLLRFRTGPAGGSPLSWAVVAAGLVPLVIGRGWRLAWAIRFWVVALCCLAIAYAGGRGWLGGNPPAAEVLLSGAGAAVAASVGLGVASLSMDLAAYRFGWRQVTSVLAAGGLCLGLLPALWATVGGRWGLPQSGFDQVLGWMPNGAAQGGYRVLWVGDPESLPLGSWRLSAGVAYGTSENGFPNGQDLFPAADPGAARLLGADLNLASRGLTTQLGHLLAPMAVRYVVVPLQVAPGPGLAGAPVPKSLVSGLLAQDDLRQVPADPSLLVLSNVAYAPERALLSSAAARASLSPDPAVAQATSLEDARPVLSGEGLRLHGAVPRGRIYLSAAWSSDWRLSVSGRPAPSRRAFGWARSFLVSSPGDGVLQQRAPAGHVIALSLELALVVLAVGFLLWRPRAQRAAPRHLVRASPPDRAGQPAREPVLSAAGPPEEGP